MFLNFVKTQTEIVRMTGDGQLADVEIHNISTSAQESSTSSSHLHSNTSHSHNAPPATHGVVPSSQTELHSLNGDYSSAPGGQPESDYDDDDDLPLQLDQAGVGGYFKY